MPTTDTDRLRNIKRFDQLVAYLRDELDWPIETDDFDDLTFDYEPEELGIDPKNAAKIEVIKQLRPLVNNQPWGIFWIKFNPKRLPVVALRRILGQLVTKKRASSNKTHQATWNLDDLMLISAIGEDEERQITFAHFAEESNRNLPTLRILGWDGADTILKLDHLNKDLHENLTWPDLDKESDHEAWRARWSSAFKLKHREVINTSKELSVRLAELARNIRKRCNAALTLETDKGPLRLLMASFKQALIHDLSEDDFADMYAQTIAYGLLSTRVSRHVPGENAVLMPEDVSDLVLPTNPFLKELMQTFFHVGGRKWSSNKGHLTGIDFDELGINDVVDALKAANMDAVLRDFGDKNPQEDPVIHFYELFLKEYDAKKRMQRGVFYTPKPVVSYIVRSVHELLQTEFGLVDGLADTTTWGEMAARLSSSSSVPSPSGRGQGEGSSAAAPSGRGQGDDSSSSASSPSGRGQGDDSSSSASSPSGRGQGEGSSSPPSIPPDLLAFARKLRRDQTDAEGLMWAFLRNRRLGNFKFRRQHPIQPYVLDFYCHEAKLAIELDGGRHNAPNARKHDTKRTDFLNKQGIKVLRFWNNEVFNETEAVMSSIWNTLHECTKEKTLTPPSPKGRGSEEFKLPEIEILNPETNKLEKKPIDPNTPFVNILDPATGTATFLVEVIDIIHKTMVAKWKKAGHMELEIPNLWNEYVPKHLLPRLHGYELMMAPYAIAHMKIGLKLFETGYSFGSDERARVYLTNALEPPQDFSDIFEQMAPALAHEAQSVNDVKRNQRFTVVIGNPPYSAHSASDSAWIRNLMRSELQDGSSSYFQVDGSPLNERNPKWLNDDYVKFIRLSQSLIAATGCGTHGYISNHGFLNNATFRGMRFSLMCTYDHIRVLDLHGNVKKHEQCPDGSKDENVFDIQQGVAISFLSRHASHDRYDFTATRGDLWGSRESKYDKLTDSKSSLVEWKALFPTSGAYLFSITNMQHDYYLRGWRITDVMPQYSSGVVTGRDKLALADSLDAMRKNITQFTDLSVSDSDIRELFFSGPRRGQRPKDKSLAPGDSTNWNLSRVRKVLARDTNTMDAVTKCLYRPFDTKYLWLHNAIIEGSRRNTMRHLLDGSNLGLIVSRMTGTAPFRDVFVARTPIEFGVMAMRVSNAAPIFPLFIANELSLHSSEIVSQPNFSSDFVSSISTTCNMIWSASSEEDGEDGNVFGPMDVFGFLYAQLHSQTYRAKFETYLQSDYPNVFVTKSAKLFRGLANIGEVLISLHLLESPLLDKPITTYTGPTNPEVEKVSYTPEDQTVWLDKAQTRGFVGVPEEVWNFHIGGYQVCHKWLKDRQKKGGKNPRPGRILTKEDLTHYQKIVVALNETIRLMKEIDETIEKHGGWPDAFITEPKKP